MNSLARILGGSPVGVLVRLFVVSLLVGWFLTWLDWTPREVWLWGRDLAFGAWGSLGALGEYAAVGALIVVPVFVVMRLIAWRGRGV